MKLHKIRYKTLDPYIDELWYKIELPVLKPILDGATRGPYRAYVGIVWGDIRDQCNEIS